MKNLYSLLILLVFSSPVISQVGINNSTPAATLDVQGDVLVDNSVYLEDPGSNDNIRGSKFLVLTTGNELSRYDIDISKYGPINYVEFAFKNLSTDGLIDYDTKISTSDYFVSIQGYSCGIAGAGRTGSIMPHSAIDALNIEGYQIYAYPNSSTGTWFLRAFVNNSTWQKYDSMVSDYVDTDIDMWLNVMIYRKGFIAKSHSDITVNMSNSPTGSIAAPSGF